ncbi:MAG: trypsin-like peptidase domain-containing protein [Pirellulales bacterium]
MRISRHFAAIILALLASALTATATFAQLTGATTVNASTAAAGDRERAYAALARDVDALEREFGLIKRVVKLVTPTVVHIEASLLPKFRGMLDVEEAGSGVIVEFGGRFYVLTNRHVIRHSSKELIRIHLTDGRVLQPERIWEDKETDVAVLAVSAPDLVAARLGDSDTLEIGDFALAIGSPFGLSQSVTRGIVSAKGRHNLDLGDGELRWQNFIQTDAAINPGNSGGPLVNLRGEVVGLNTAIASASGGNEGIGFSIPINIVARTGRQLVDNNRVARGFLGVKLDGRFDEKQAKTLGLTQLVGTRVTVIEPQSPAERAALQVNDVILQYNGVRVERDTHLIGLVKLTEVGQRVPIVVYRDGHPLNMFVEIGDMGEYPANEQ